MNHETLHNVNANYLHPDLIYLIQIKNNIKCLIGYIRNLKFCLVVYIQLS